jgi:hypothetical protein
MVSSAETEEAKTPKYFPEYRRNPHPIASFGCETK